MGWGADTTHIHSILLQLIVILWLVTNLFPDCTETDGHASHGQIYHRHRRDSSWPTAVCTPTGAAGPLPPSLQVRYESPLYQWEHAISLVSRSRKHPRIAHHVYADSTLWRYRWTSCPCPGSQAEGKPLPHLVVKQQDVGNSPACHAYLVYLQCKPWYEPRPLSVSRLLSSVDCACIALIVIFGSIGKELKKQLQTYVWMYRGVRVCQKSMLQLCKVKVLPLIP